MFLMDWMGELSPHQEIPAGVVLIGTYASLLVSWGRRALNLSAPSAGLWETRKCPGCSSWKRKEEKALFFLWQSRIVTPLWEVDLVLVVMGNGVGIGRGRNWAGSEGAGRKGLDESLLWYIVFLLCDIFFFSSLFPRVLSRL